MAAANKSVTGISIIGPITTSIILGGINIPNVPPAVIVPAANLTSYPDLFMDFAAMIPKIVTEAPTIPVAAAKTTETKKTVRSLSKKPVYQILDNQKQNLKKLM